MPLHTARPLTNSALFRFLNSGRTVVTTVLPLISWRRSRLAALVACDFVFQNFVDSTHTGGITGLTPELAPVGAGGPVAASLDADFSRMELRAVQWVLRVLVAFKGMFHALVLEWVQAARIAFEARGNRTIIAINTTNATMPAKHNTSCG